MSHTCERCPAVVAGNAKVCGRCRDAERLCAECGRERGRGRARSRLCATCRAKRYTRRPPLVFTPEMDATIREVYASGVHGTKALLVLERRLGLDRRSIARRARRIGAATVRTKEAAWSEAEIAILSEWAWQCPERISARLGAAGFRRTVTAVAQMRARMRLRADADGMTATALAEWIGHDAGTVARWIRLGKLRAERQSDRPGAQYHVTDAAFRAFVVAHYEQIDLGKVERAGGKLWLLDLLTNGRVGATVERARRAT